MWSNGVGGGGGDVVRWCGLESDQRDRDVGCQFGGNKFWGKELGREVCRGANLVNDLGIICDL